MIEREDSFFGKPIYVYSRAQAVEDGVLVDITRMAKEAGFKIPVAVTHAVWDEYIDWTNEDSKRQTQQDLTGRLWDILWMLHLACRHNSDEAYLNYRLYVIPRDGRSKKPRQIELKAVIGGGDNGEPVITIMLPNED
jgi:hypothetical protein